MFFRPCLHRLGRLYWLAGVLLLAGCQGAAPALVFETPVQPVAAATLLPTVALAPSLAAPTPVPAATAVTPPAALLPDVFNAAPPVGSVAYVLPLTVRHVTSTGAILFCELNQPVSAALYLRPIAGDPATTQAIPLNPTQTRHQIELEGLQPGMEYQALVGVSAADGRLEQPAFSPEVWGAVRFRTAADREPLRFGVFGDASFGDAATAALMERMLTYNLDFAIHTGDVVAEVQNDPSPPDAYAHKFYAALSGLLHRMPVYTVIGNHDYDAAARWQERPYYYHAFPPFTDPNFAGAGASGIQQYYVFTYQGIQFLMLDTQVLFGVEGREAQDAWMTERLADPRFRYTIPVFHVPPFFSGSVHPSDGDVVRQLWRPRFAAARVPVVFSGHSHHYERLLADETTYIVSGGGSSILYAPGELRSESQVYARRTHFVLAEVYADHIRLTAIDKDDEILDTWNIPTP